MQPPPNVIPFPNTRRRHPSMWGGVPAPSRARRRVSVLAAELRGHRTITEALGAVRAEAALAGCVDHALATLARSGAVGVTLDGDPMQPVLSGTFEGEGHAMRALRAGEALCRDVDAVQAPAPPERRYQVCVGVNTGEIAQVSLGGDDSKWFEWIGTLRSFAVRLQEFAGPSQVLLSSDTLQEVGGLVTVRSMGEVRVNAHGERRASYVLAGTRPAGGGILG